MRQFSYSLGEAALMHSEHAHKADMSKSQLAMWIRSSMIALVGVDFRADSFVMLKGDYPKLK